MVRLSPPPTIVAAPPPMTLPDAGTGRPVVAGAWACAAPAAPKAITEAKRALRNMVGVLVCGMARWPSADRGIGPRTPRMRTHPTDRLHPRHGSDGAAHRRG